MKIAVIGAGGWGTALAMVLQQNGHDVVLWGRDPLLMKSIQEQRLNTDYLPGVSIPQQIRLSSGIEEAMVGAEITVMAVPSHAMRDMCAKLKSTRNSELETGIRVFVNVAKGIEADTGLRMSQVIQQVMPAARVVTLSGPSHAEEVARGIPTAVVAASAHADGATIAQKAFMNDRFRVYTSADVTGVELGGALKNIIALAAGACDGLGLGDNSKAALITRGLAEMARLGIALGAQRETFSGLSGLGDLVVTCTSRHSRNRSVGERLGKGEKIEDILASMEMVAEGVRNARSAFALARKHDARTPIIDEVHAIIYQGKSPKQAVRDLMTRDPREEI